MSVERHPGHNSVWAKLTFSTASLEGELAGTQKALLHQGFILIKIPWQAESLFPPPSSHDAIYPQKHVRGKKHSMTTSKKFPRTQNLYI